MNTFCKSERLCSKTLFEELLASNYSFIKYPYRIVVRKSSQPQDLPARIAISVSKKKFKRAVKRNRIKRLTREAFRLNKQKLYTSVPDKTTLDILFIYLDGQIVHYRKAEKAVQEALEKIILHFNALPPHD